MNNWAAKIWSFTEEFNFMIMIGKYWAAKIQGRMNVWTMDAVNVRGRLQVKNHFADMHHFADINQPLNFARLDSRQSATPV